MIKQLEIERYVKWIRPVDKPRLIEMLNAADMCFDDFGYGFYGLATLEALSVGTPTFSYLDKELAGREAPPIINVKSSDQIYEGMAGLASDRNKLKEIGKNSREWALEHHRCEKVINRYLDLYEEVLGKQ